jgi:TetR/AcrR family transcriptional regulator
MAQREALGREVPEELAEKLFHASFALFGEKGFERTTMDEVAARSGVARATLYYYFRGKDDLFVFLLERGVSMLGAALGEATQSGATARERLEQALDRMIDLLAEFRDVLLVAMQQFGRIALREDASHARLHERSTGTLKAILEEGARDGSLQTVDPEGAALAMFGAACWLCLHHIQTSGRVPTAEVKALMRRMVVEGLCV